jgi:hypothetical protein
MIDRLTWPAIGSGLTDPTAIAQQKYAVLQLVFNGHLLLDPR